MTDTAVAVFETLGFPNRLHGTVNVTIFNDRDALLTEFGLATLKDRYLLPGETPQRLFARVASWFARDEAHAQRVYDAMSKLWFMPATPVLSNGGTSRGLPISCFLNAVPDSMPGIRDTWSENVNLASGGGGIGTYWGDVREKAAPIAGRGKTSGVIPFIKVMDSLTLAVSQGSLRRGSAAVYLDIHHPEVEEFIDIRRPTGDANRRCINIHHGLMIDDAFMEAVVANESYNLISPLSKLPVKSVKARELFIKIITARLETGEPYMVFTDTVNRKVSPLYKALGLKVRQSNLCSEIALHTGIDYLGADRTAVCCLSSLNMETWDQWRGDRLFLKDVLYFVDGVMEDFIERTKTMPGFEKARYSARMERSIGLGVMGFHSYLQQKGVPFDSEVADGINREFFGWFQHTGDEINVEAAKELGQCIDSLNAPEVCPVTRERLKPYRWAHWSSIAPTASISIIAGNASPCTEPWPGNVFTQKTLSGSFSVRNRYLEERLLKEASLRFGREQQAEALGWVEDQWTSIMSAKGSVQHLDYLSDHDKAVFATAFELDQKAVIRQAADRAPHIGQMASVNISLPGDTSKAYLVKLHIDAWRMGVPSLYYCRSISIARAMNVAGEMPQPREPHIVTLKDNGPATEAVVGETCEACQ